MPCACWCTGAKYTADPVLDYCWERFVDDWPALNQQWAATLAKHWTGIGCVGLHPLYEVLRSDALNGCWPAPAMVVEEIHVEGMFWLVSLVLSLFISWTFRILAHDEDQHSYVYKILSWFLSMALKETKAGPRSSGTPVLVYNRNNLDFLSKLPSQILTELSKNA